MSPKKKGKGKKGKGKGKKGKGKGKKGKKHMDAKGMIASEEMTREELLNQVKLIQAELEREREERNYFQLERDKINTFWEITKRQLDEKKAEVRNKDREIEDAEERHQNEIRVYKQKVKHLLYEHQNNISELKAENTVIIKMAEDNHSLSEMQLRKDKRALKANMKEKERANFQVIQNLKKKNDDLLSSLLIKHKNELQEMEMKYGNKTQTVREELELKHKTEIHDTEEMKNLQISNLMKNHERAFSEMKIYYNDITLNNIALINSLREQVETLKKKEDRMNQGMKDLEEANKLLVDPLQKTRQKLMAFKVKLSNYEKVKDLFKAAKARLKLISDELHVMKWDKEVLEQAFHKIQEERDDLYQRFMSAIHEVQQKCNFKNLFLETKLSALTVVLEKKESQLNEVLSISNLNPEALAVVTEKLEDVLDSKNKAIKDLQYELARVCKAHDDLLHTCESKLGKFGITCDLGFPPMSSTVRGQTVGLIKTV